jgi:hypothetical protein
MLLFTNPPAPDTASSAAPLAVTFRNHGTHGATLFFEPGDGLVLRHPHGTFAANYLRALLLMFLRLALFAAIGVTLGTLFSMPVAAFLGLVLMLVLQLSGFIRAAAQADRQTFVANVAAFGQAGHAHDGDSADSPAPSLAARALANALFAPTAAPGSPCGRCSITALRMTWPPPPASPPAMSPAPCFSRDCCSPLSSPSFPPPSSKNANGPCLNSHEPLVSQPGSPRPP